MGLGKSPRSLVLLPLRSFGAGHLTGGGSSASHGGCKNLAMVGDAAGGSWWALAGIRSDETKSSSQNRGSLGALVEERGLGRAARLGFLPAREMLWQEALRLVATHTHAERYLELSV